MIPQGFCELQNLQCRAGEGYASVKWNAEHAIFAGHFPGQPVVPGVCMLQLVKELLQQCLHKMPSLRESSQMKFLQFIDPRIDPVVEIRITYSENSEGLLAVKATIDKDARVFFKFSGLYAV